MTFLAGLASKLIAWAIEKGVRWLAGLIALNSAIGKDNTKVDKNINAHNAAIAKSKDPKNKEARKEKNARILKTDKRIINNY